MVPEDSPPHVEALSPRSAAGSGTDVCEGDVESGRVSPPPQTDPAETGSEAAPPVVAASSGDAAPEASDQDMVSAPSSPSLGEGIPTNVDAAAQVAQHVGHDADRWCEMFKAAGDGTSNPDMNVIRSMRVRIFEQTQKVIDGIYDPNPDPYIGLLNLERKPDTTKWLYKGAKPGKTRCCGSTSSQGNFQAGETTSPQAMATVPEVRIVERDMLAEAQDLHAQGLTVAVLNMASQACPGGGYLTGAGAQEENLHRRSDAVRFTVGSRAKNYPIPEDACLVSKNVTVFRGTEKDGYPFLAAPFKVTVLSCAAVRHPKLTVQREYFQQATFKRMEKKVAAIVKGAESSQCDAVVLSAFGCGAFGNPPEIVANLFRKALRESSLRLAVFCVFDDHNSGMHHNPNGNFIPFKNVFE
eukprot:TRINITY_DN50142_c0_g1_i1.p1 TRINITY_DN50142_c0_g1~~TRINITY_DN50142_c0_g1_i1.p1  ORF type:complete len:431 (-),score=69.03 TRINITY_DN50142_c0_g1_i1:197-1429(-)